PDYEHHNFLLRMQREFNDKLTLSTDVVYAKQANTLQISRGTVTANVYGPGSAPTGGAGQINPFFQGPPGATSEAIRFDADQLFGPGARNAAGAESLFATFNLEYKLPGDWRATLGSTIGRDDSRLRVEGTLCASCALLALNGTTNSSGNITTPSVPGTTTA